MQPKAAIVRYARQKLRYAAGADMSRVTHGYFVSHSPRIWRPMSISHGVETDPEYGDQYPVASVYGTLNSIRPALRHGGIGESGSHGGHYQRSIHVVPSKADQDDALFAHSHQADNETDLHEDEAKRYVAGQRAVRKFIGLNPQQTSYLTPVLTSRELAHEAARATGGFVHEVQLNPRQFEGNNIPVLNARDGAAVLFKTPGLGGPISDSTTHVDINRQIALAHSYGSRKSALKHLHLLNQQYWPLLTQHADALQTLPGAPHPHQAFLGKTLRNQQHLLAPSHEELLQAGEPISTIYQMALRHPEEPVHRMALADTLDDHGHSGAADFFRSTLPGSENTAQPQKLSRRGDVARPSADEQPAILTPEIGFNVNDKSQAFTDQILSGDKTIETRNKPTLHPYIGQRMGLVRTGKGKAQLVGYVTIGKPKLYTSQRAFDAEAGSHLVGSDSPFHISKTKNGSKWGYELLDVERIEPRHLVDGSGIAPNPRVARKLQRSSSSSSSSLRSLVVGYAAQKLKYAAAQPRFQVGSEVLVRGNDDIMRRAVYRGPNQHHESNHYVDIIAHDGSLIRNVQTPHDRIRPVQASRWFPRRGERVRIRFPNGQMSNETSSTLTYDVPHSTLDDHHAVNVVLPDGGWGGRLMVANHDLFHATDDINPQAAPEPSKGDAWTPQRDDRVLVTDASGATRGASYVGARGNGHFVSIDGNPNFSFVLGDQIRHPNGITRMTLTQQDEPNVPPPAPKAPTLRLEKLLANGHGHHRAVGVANALRDAFARMFKRPVSDGIIMKALRVPMTFPGSDPNHPLFADEKIGLHVDIGHDKVSASTKSNDPDYRFEARTTVDPRRIYNSSQKHGGYRDASGSKAKVYSTPHILLNQADAAHELDIPALDVSAAMDNKWKQGDYSGGIVWPMYGYNGRISQTIHGDAKHRAVQFLRSSQTPASAKDPSDMTLRDIVQAPGGKEFLRQSTDHHDADGAFQHRDYHNAPSGPMVFDTHPTSDSRKTLANEIRKVENHARAAASEGAQAAG